MKSYCPSCGEAAEYTLKKPTFCPHCGKTMEFSGQSVAKASSLSLKAVGEDLGSVLTHKNKPISNTAPIVNDNIEDSDTSNTSDFSDAFTNEKPEEFLIGRRQSGIKLGELGKMAKTGFIRTSNEIPKAPKNKKAIAEWMRDAGKTRPIEIDDNGVE